MKYIAINITIVLLGIFESLSFGWVGPLTEEDVNLSCLVPGIYWGKTYEEHGFEALTVYECG